MPDSKNERTLKILDRWVKGEIKTGQADRELQLTGIHLTTQEEARKKLGLHKGNEG